LNNYLQNPGPYPTAYHVINGVPHLGNSYQEPIQNFYQNQNLNYLQKQEEPDPSSVFVVKSDSRNNNFGLQYIKPQENKKDEK
jgi:hypothetical protein